MKKKLNWGIIGTGNIANDFAENFNDEYSHLYAIASRTYEKAEKFAKKYRISEAFGEYEQLIENENVDVVYIATPHNLHYEDIYHALESGKHVVSEKVIVTDADQLKRLVKKAQEKDLYLFEAMTIHYMPIYEEIKKYAKNKELGKLKVVQVNFGSYKTTDQSYYFFNKDLAGGAIFDIGVYALNFARYFLSSSPTQIETIGYLNKYGVDETSGIVLKNNNDEIATVTLSFRAKLPKVGIVAYEKGYFTVPNYPRADSAIFTSVEGEIENLKIGDSSEGLSYEAKAISKMILNKEEQLNLDFTIDVLEIMDVVREKWGLVYPFEQ